MSNFFLLVSEPKLGYLLGVARVDRLTQMFEIVENSMFTASRNGDSKGICLLNYSGYIVNATLQ